MEYLHTIRDKNWVRNMEMDSLQIGSFCSHIGVRCAVMCVVLVNRFERDQINPDPKVLEEYNDTLIKAMVQFVMDNTTATNDDDSHDSEGLSD